MNLVYIFPKRPIESTVINYDDDGNAFVIAKKPYQKIISKLLKTVHTDLRNIYSSHIAGLQK